MAQILKPPTPLLLNDPRPSVFLAGSIEMGQPVDWQTRVTADLQDLDVLLLNPRREDWDASWQQTIDNLQFREQVEWELAAQERATLIAMYFEPSTRAPITLLELGLFARSGKVAVCCPEGFWRKGNVDIVCRRYQVTQVFDLPELVAWVRRALRN